MNLLFISLYEEPHFLVFITLIYHFEDINEILAPDFIILLFDKDQRKCEETIIVYLKKIKTSIYLFKNI